MEDVKSIVKRAKREAEERGHKLGIFYQFSQSRWRSHCSYCNNWVDVDPFATPQVDGYVLFFRCRKGPWLERLIRWFKRG